MPLTANGIYFEHWGASTNSCPLTLINGFARSMSDFRSLARSLQKASIGVIMLDNRTTGKTTAPAPFTLNNLVGDVIEVWDNVGIDRSHILGISMGGAIAINVALQHQHRVTKLIIVSSFTSKTHNNDDELEVEKVRARIINSVAPSFYAKNKLLMHTLAQQAAAKICSGVHRPQAQALQNYDIRTKLKDIRCPTLILHGDMDSLVPKREAEAFAAGIAGAKLVVFEEAGHMLLMEKHGELLAEVVNFINN